MLLSYSVICHTIFLPFLRHIWILLPYCAIFNSLDKPPYPLSYEIPNTLHIAKFNTYLSFGQVDIFVSPFQFLILCEFTNYSEFWKRMDQSYFSAYEINFGNPQGWPTKNI